MAIKIQMPKLADTMTEGTLVKWRKKVGDKVEAGDILAEVETDKATMEMEAFDDGVISKLLVEEGTKVPIGESIAILTEEGESAEAETDDDDDQDDRAEGAEVTPSTPAPRQEQPKPEPAPIAPAPVQGSGGARVKASPLARKIAAESGVNLASLKGSGPGGRIVAKDVENAPKAAVGQGKSSAVSVAKPVAGGADRKVALSGMRKTIAQRLLESKTTIPHFYLHVEIDAGPLVRVRSEVNAAGEKDGVKLTFNDFVVRAVAIALARMPKVNASFAGDSVVEYGAVNLAVAVAIEDGLVTPVIRDANTKSILELSAAVKDLASRARSKKLKPEEYQGGTFTISNLGAYGIDSFDAIINPPQSAILSVANIVKKPVVSANDQIVVGQRMNLGLSADHRVVDGALAAQFIGELKKLLENPSYLLM